jgi:hypothetical protein
MGHARRRRRRDTVQVFLPLETPLKQRRVLAKSKHDDRESGAYPAFGYEETRAFWHKPKHR